MLSGVPFVVVRTRYVIYCHTSPSGKQYIGQTSKTMEKRWRAHVKEALYKKTTAHVCPIFHAAIRKYGAAAFTHEVLDVVFSQGGADIAERVWIEKCGTISPGGYNLANGGRVHAMHESTRQKLSVIHKALRASHTDEKKVALASKIREALALLSPEERSDIVRRGRATLTPERRAWVMQQMATARLANAAARRALKPEKKIDAKLSALRKADWAATPPERRSERGQKIWETRRRNALELSSLPPEQRKVRADFHRQQRARKTPEQAAENRRKGWEARRRNAKMREFRQLVAEIRVAPVDLDGPIGYGC